MCLVACYTSTPGGGKIHGMDSNSNVRSDATCQTAARGLSVKLKAAYVGYDRDRWCINHNCALYRVCAFIVAVSHDIVIGKEKGLCYPRVGHQYILRGLIVFSLAVVLENCGQMGALKVMVIPGHIPMTKNTVDQYSLKVYSNFPKLRSKAYTKDYFRATSYAASIWFSASPVQMNGTVTNISATNLLCEN